MSRAKEFGGYYGSGKTPCVVFSYKHWYCVQGSVNVNRTHMTVSDGVYVEEIDDYDTCTAQEPIETLEEFEAFIDEE